MAFAEPLTDALNTAVGDRIRADDDFAMRTWSALANVEWTAPDGSRHWESFRNASVAVSDIRGRGEDNYWYLRGQIDGVVDPEIDAAMASIGWTWRAVR